MSHRLIEPFHFIVDECLGRRLHDALVKCLLPEETARRMRDYLGNGTLDEDWLPAVGRDRLVVLTKGDQLRHVPNEQALILSSNAAVFMVKNATGDE